MTRSVSHAQESGRRHLALGLGLLFAGLASSAGAEPLSLPAEPSVESAVESVPRGAAKASKAAANPAAPTASTPSILGVPQSVDSFLSGDGSGGAASGAGAAYSPALGSHIRARWSTQSYGQTQGNLDLGTMKLWGDEDGMWFLDGQVTLNDTNKVGFNTGLGFRKLTLPFFPSSPDSAKIFGASVWADGQSVRGENFFPQVGASLEMLGDRLDFRANGYFPVGPRSQTRDFAATGELGFSGNFIAPMLLGYRDQALTVYEAEVAGRILDLDAWVFGGAYGFNGGPYSEVGGKIGLRGYATPDLLLSIAITNDDLFDTNGVFTATWFIGRTRRENCPSGTLRDRFREPVLRNDYVAIRTDRATGFGSALTNAAGDAVRVVHLDSGAAAGGDGTAERPLSSLDGISTNSQTGDIILAHAGSSFSGSVGTLLDNQTLVGEGLGRTFSVTTSGGSVVLPESSTGARDGALPILNGVAGLATITLADNNRVQNVAFSGGQNAIVNGANGSASPTLNNLTISNTTGDAVSLVAFNRVDTADVDNDGNTTETFDILGNVNVSNVTFNGNAGNDINVDGRDSGPDATNQVTETVTITGVTSNKSSGSPSIAVRDTSNNTGSTTTITGYTYNGSGAAGGALLFDRTGGVVSTTTSTITGGAGPAVQALSTRGSVSVGGTNTIRDITGDAVVVNGATGSVGIDADITTGASATGGTVRVTGNTGIVTVNGDIQSRNAGAVVVDNSQANVTFAGAIESIGSGDTVTITNAGSNASSSASVTFTGTVTNDALGQIVRIDDGDDRIAFNGAVTDSGAGVVIGNRKSGGDVLFTGQTTLTTGAAQAVTLTSNDTNSSVDFTNLDITTTSGDAIVGTNFGRLNVTGTGNTITTGTGRALALNTGSSQTGITFSDVTTTTGSAAAAVDLNEINGAVTINGGSIVSTGGSTAVVVNNAGLTIDGADITSGSTTAASVTLSDATARSFALRNAELNGDGVAVTSSGTGTRSITLSDLTGAGALTVAHSGSASLTSTLTNVTGTGNVALNLTGTGAGSMNVTNLNTSGTVTGTTSSSGNLTVSVSGSGGTTPLGAITITDTGAGNATATFANVTSSSGITYASGGAGTALLGVSGGSYGGPILATATNSGSFTASVTGATTLTNGRVSLDAQNSGDVSFTVSTLAFNTGSNNDAIRVNLGPNVANGSVTVSNNTGVTTSDARALSFASTGGNVNFLLSGNQFTNNSNASRTALIDSSGAGTLNATITNNRFTNTNALSPAELEIVTSSGAPSLNLNLAGNDARESGGGLGSGEIAVTETAGTISIFQRDATFNNTGTRNNATLLFTPNDVNQFDDLTTAPTTP